MQESIYRFVYRSLVGLLALSLFLLAFINGLVPFGLRATWSDEGAGVSLVVSQPLTQASEGAKLAVIQDRAAETATGVVTGITRRDGVLTYNMTGAVPQASVPARDVYGSVLLIVPFVGVWVRALTHMLGIMALVGIPVSMLAIDLLLTLSTRFLSGLGKTLTLRIRTATTIEEEAVAPSLAVASPDHEYAADTNAIVTTPKTRVSAAEPAHVIDGLSVRISPRHTPRRLHVEDAEEHDSTLGQLLHQGQRYSY